MNAISVKASIGVLVLAVAGLAGCARTDAGHDELGWAMAALQRNPQLQVVASDAAAGTVTVRMKNGGALRVLHPDELVASPPPGLAGGPTSLAGSAATSPGAPAAVQNAEVPAHHAPGPAALPPQVDSAVAPPQPDATASRRETVPADVTPPPATAANTVVAGSPSGTQKPTRSESASGATPGSVLASGPGYTIKAATDAHSKSPRRAASSGPAASVPVERRHDPIICQGQRFLQIDNRNLAFDADAVSAEDGCELHITNSRITAGGVGVSARNANVHIENSEIEGNSGSVDAADGAQVYLSSSTFKGLRRREDSAAFHDLGGNVWN